ncbi:hypothetical protein [Paenibacillus taichungensis]|uniref:hypothetical protein n=1 Tax=Paenibacillus taichungensis TaxID=484184 RepID=UPI0039A4EA78
MNKQQLLDHMKDLIKNSPDINYDQAVEDCMNLVNRLTSIEDSNETLRYTFEYINKSNGEMSEFSQMATSREEAETLIIPRIADLEFAGPEDIVLGDLISISKKVGDNYIACEGCAS